MSDPEIGGPERLGPHDYLVVLGRRWRSVAAVVVTVVLLALGWSFVQTPQYLAHADVLIEPSSAEVAAGGGTEVSAEEVATQVQVVASQPVARLVAERLQLDPVPDLTDLVSVEAVGASRILRITARDSDPEEAARTASAVARSYLAFREEEAVRAFEAASANLAARQGDVQEQLNAIESQLALNGNRQQELDLQAERRSLLTRLGQLSAQMSALQESLTASMAGGALLRAATAPQSPVSPRPLLTGVLGALLGLMLGASVALVRDRYDDVVHDEEMVRRALGGAVVLGRIPRWQDNAANRDRFVTLFDPHSAASEAYQRLGVNVRFLLATVDKRLAAPVVLVTSPLAGEGKTSTAGNLGVVAARLGLRVVLVDGDLRRAGAAARLGLGDPPGLSDLLASDDASAAYLIDLGLEPLRFLPAGTIPPNPTALLSSARMRKILEELVTEADLVIIDSPPLTEVADTLELTALADVVLVVAREGVSRRRDLVTVMESLRHVGPDPVGAVYNALDDGGRRFAYYGVRERVTPADPREEDDRPHGTDPTARSREGAVLTRAGRPRGAGPG